MGTENNTWIAFSFLMVSRSGAQTPEADSLLEAASAETDPNEKARIFLQLSELSASTNPASALDPINQAAELANDDELLGDIYDQKGRIHFALGELGNALTSFQEAKMSKERAGNESQAAGINNRVGVVLLRQKNIRKLWKYSWKVPHFLKRRGMK